MFLREDEQNSMRLTIPGQIIEIWILMVDIIHIICPVPDRIGKEYCYTIRGHLRSKGLSSFLVKIGRQEIIRLAFLGIPC